VTNVFISLMLFSVLFRLNLIILHPGSLIADGNPGAASNSGGGSGGGVSINVASVTGHGTISAKGGDGNGEGTGGSGGRVYFKLTEK